ncbi:hypothetical protein QAD02_003963, partial [Eretmocerus hayati]
TTPDGRAKSPSSTSKPSNRRVQMIYQDRAYQGRIKRGRDTEMHTCWFPQPRSGDSTSAKKWTLSEKNSLREKTSRSKKVTSDQCWHEDKYILAKDCYDQCVNQGNPHIIGGVCTNDICFCDWQIPGSEYDSTFITLEKSKGLNLNQLEWIMRDEFPEVCAAGSKYVTSEECRYLCIERNPWPEFMMIEGFCEEGWCHCVSSRNRTIPETNQTLQTISEESVCLLDDKSNQVESQPSTSQDSDSGVVVTDECPAHPPVDDRRSSKICKYGKKKISEKDCDEKCREFGKIAGFEVKRGICHQGKCHCEYYQYGSLCKSKLTSLEKDEMNRAQRESERSSESRFLNNNNRQILEEDSCSSRRSSVR